MLNHHLRHRRQQAQSPLDPRLVQAKQQRRRHHTGQEDTAIIGSKQQLPFFSIPDAPIAPDTHPPASVSEPAPDRTRRPLPTKHESIAPLSLIPLVRSLFYLLFPQPLDPTTKPLGTPTPTPSPSPTASNKMASSASLVNMGTVMKVVVGASAVSAIYAGHTLVSRGDITSLALRFFTGPGRTSRILLLLLAAFNLKSIPFAWTLRIFGAMFRHTLWPRKPVPVEALFHYSITSSATSLLETDYNLHKSNSTYFSDLDTSRTHLVMYLLGPGVSAAGRNQTTKLIRDPANPDKVMPGSFGVGLGAVFCSFRKEIAPYQGYEMWSRVLSWDRKWLYIVTHFVIKGKVKPAHFDGPNTSGKPTKAWTPEDEAKLQKYVIATAISKYVFKMGRFTVHPAYLVEASGLLPERPGADGWRGGEAGVGDLAQSVEPEIGDEAAAAWTWKDVERARRQGMLIAEKFAGLDEAHSVFDGGKKGALGVFGPG